MKDERLIPIERIEKAIFLIRGQKVMLDADLARLYSVQTRELVQAMKRNIERCPEDFAFQLTPEHAVLISHSVISKTDGRGGRRKYLPYAFTEQGVGMLSGRAAVHPVHSVHSVHGPDYWTRWTQWTQWTDELAALGSLCSSTPSAS
jgi:hypothetical protein